MSLFSESDSKLYQVFSLSSIALLYSDSLESGGKESPDWLSNKSRKSNKPPKVAILALDKKRVSKEESKEPW